MTILVRNFYFTFVIAMLTSIATPSLSWADDAEGLAFAAQVTEKIRQENTSLKPEGEYFLADPTLARLRIHVPSEVLGKVLTAGSFLNQYQTGNSGGGYDPAARWRLEQKISGLKFDKNQKKNPEFLSYLPKYTTVDLPDFSHDSTVLAKWASQMKSDERLGQYGNIIVYLKDEVKKRATFTVTDSGEVVMPQVQSFTQGKLVLESNEVMRSDYFEAQVWGPLKVSDIDFVVLDPSSLSQQLGEMLASKGLKVHLFSYEEAPLRMVSYQAQAADLSKPVGFYVPRDFLKHSQDMKRWFQGMTIAQIHTAIEMSLHLDPASAETVAASMTLEQIEHIGAELKKSEWNLEDRNQNLLKLAEVDARFKNIFQKLATPAFLSQRSAEELASLAKILRGTAAGKILEKSLLDKFVASLRGTYFDRRLVSQIDVLAQIDSRAMDAFLDFVAKNPASVMNAGQEVYIALSKVSLTSVQIDKVIEILAKDTYQHAVGVIIAVAAKNYSRSPQLSAALQDLLKAQFSGNTDFSAKNILSAMEVWPSVDQPLRDYIKELVDKSFMITRYKEPLKVLLEKRPAILSCDRVFAF